MQSQSPTFEKVGQCRLGEVRSALMVVTVVLVAVATLGAVVVGLVLAWLLQH